MDERYNRIAGRIKYFYTEPYRPLSISEYRALFGMITDLTGFEAIALNKFLVVCNDGMIRLRSMLLIDELYELGIIEKPENCNQ